MKIDAYTTPGTERETRLNASDLLRAMESAGIDRAVIAPEDREIAVANAAGNQQMIDLARASAGRFIPACAANPWFGRAAVDEVRRAAGEGARMLVLAPALQGFVLTDEICDNLFAYRLGMMRRLGTDEVVINKLLETNAPRLLAGS